MNKKITLLAWAGRGAAFGAIGLTNGVMPSAARHCRARNPSEPSSPARATDPKPPPISQRNSRRVRPQNEEWAGRPTGAGEAGSMAETPSVEVQEGIGIE